MSVETPKVQETAPAQAGKPVESTATPAETTAPTSTDHTNHTVPTDFTLGTTEPATATEGHATEAKETTGATGTAEATPVTHATKEHTAVDAVPATEGVLGYKAPGLLKQFRYVKHFFWFSEEPYTEDALDSYVKSEKADVAHHNAAWARETGKGMMFYTKRAEDKATPSGMIFLPEATAVTKTGMTDFSFKAGHHTHKFEAASSAERDSWVAAIEKIIEETKDMKTDVTGRETYKNAFEGYSSHAAVAGTSSTPLKHDTPRKSHDASTATAAATHDSTSKAAKADTSSSSSDEEAKRAKKAEKEAAKKERSQSRKRNSVFGLFGKKDDDKTEKKAEKEHDKEAKKHDHQLAKEHDKDVKKAEKEHEKDVKKHDHQLAKEHDKEVKKHDHEVAKEQQKHDHELAKEEKKIEAEHKKEEARAEHDHPKAKEASEPAALAAAPVTVATHADKKEEERAADKPVERHEDITTPTEKKNKRSSVFGGFFGKNKVTSPSSERSEKEVAPIVPAKDEISAVSETAPKLDEPVATKPLDTAAVTAPVDGAETTTSPAVATTEESRTGELGSAPETTSTPRTEKKSFLSGLMKKHDKKEEPREEPMTNEEAVKESAPINTASDSAVAEPTTETPVKETEAAREGRPAPEKRRTSLFGSLGTLKRKSDKSPEPSSVAADETRTPTTKREKSPMPSKLGSLFRKPSRAQKPTEEVKTDTPTTVAQPESATEAPKTISENETPASDTAAKLHGETDVTGDHHTSTFHDVVTSKPEEVKSTA